MNAHEKAIMSGFWTHQSISQKHIQADWQASQRIPFACASVQNQLAIPRSAKVMSTDEDVETHTTPTDLDRCPVQLKRGAFQLRFQVSCHTRSDHANEARISPRSNDSNAVTPDRFIPAQMLLTSDFRTLIEEFLIAVKHLMSESKLALLVPSDGITFPHPLWQNKDALCMRSFRVLAVDNEDSNVMSCETRMLLINRSYAHHIMIGS